MKRLVASVGGGFLVLIYFGAIFAASQRIQAQGRGATANGSERTHAASSSKSEAAKAAAKTPGELLTQNAKLSDKLSTLLKQQNPPVTDLQAASHGFNNLGQFVAAVHISDNLGIPFDQLKGQAQGAEAWARRFTYSDQARMPKPKYGEPPSSILTT